MHELYQPVSDILRQVSREVVLPHYQNLQSGDIQEKSPGDLVTIADMLSEEMLSEKLHALLPEAQIIGEEAVNANPAIMDRLADDTVWIIDPIDGTGNFAAGRPPFGIIIALVRNGRTNAGWLFDPLTSRICHAAENGGAFINRLRAKPALNPIDKPVAALATGFMTKEQRTEVIAQAKAHYNLVPIPNCAAQQYPQLVLGTHHISIFKRTLPWDHAAGVLFLNEAGGKAARWDGSDYLPGDGRTGMLGASSLKLWDEAAELLGGIFAN